MKNKSIDSSRFVNFMFGFVRILPDKLIYYCFLHVIGYATTGKYSTTDPSLLSCMDAIDRFDKKSSS